MPPFNLSEKEEIIAGPNGNLWFSDFIGDRIGRITPTGQVRVFPLRNAQGITAGRDGNVWVALGGEIARITPAGQIDQVSPACAQLRGGADHRARWHPVVYRVRHE